MTPEVQAIADRIRKGFTKFIESPPKPNTPEFHRQVADQLAEYLSRRTQRLITVEPTREEDGYLICNVTVHPLEFVIHDAEP